MKPSLLLAFCRQNSSKCEPGNLTSPGMASKVSTQPSGVGSMVVFGLAGRDGVPLSTNASRLVPNRVENHTNAYSMNCKVIFGGTRRFTSD